jgi:hypothetical protein
VNPVLKITPPNVLKRVNLTRLKTKGARPDNAGVHPPNVINGLGKYG